MSAPSAPSASVPPADPAAGDSLSPARGRERKAFGILALAALAAIVRLAVPVGVGLFLGALLAFTSEPIYARLRRRHMKAGPAALLCALGATTIVSSVVIALTMLLVTRGLLLLAFLRTQLAPGMPLRTSAEGAVTRLGALHVNVADLSQKIENEAVSLGSRAAGIAAGVAGATFSGLLTLFFMTLATYFVLHHWNAILTRSERLLPFERRHTHALLEQFRNVGREVFLGTVVTGLVQGLFAGIGYWITGLPEPAFFGAMTALASLIPGIGTLLVWVPAGILQIVSGHPGAGLAQLIYSTLTVGVASDYVIRPWLVGSEKNVPSIFMFVALFGGVEVFGVIGLILGPVIVTMSLAVLKTYEREIAPRGAGRDATPVANGASPG